MILDYLVGPKCHHKGLYKRDTGGTNESRHCDHEAEIGVTHFEDGRRDEKQRRHRVHYRM